MACKTDRIFAGLFAFQWLLGIIFAVWLSPQTWVGTESQIHAHVYAAVFLGGLAAAFPIFLILTQPGHTLNRYVVATAQMFFSILFIHLTGGRIETHFHVFGSLAFLAFYRDYRPLLLATAITTADHLLRGAYWPQSVYGVLAVTPLRAFEHAAWVLFEDFFLFISMKIGLEELWKIAKHQAAVESTLESVEKTVEERTRELKKSQQTIVEQQQALISSAKMSALGEMAGGVAHEINTPLAVISMRVEQLEECVKDGDFDALDVVETLGVVKTTTDRIAQIVRGLRFFARDGRRLPAQKASVATIVEDTLSLCRERFSNHGVQLEVIKDQSYPQLSIECRSVEISQVLLNLLSNSFDAISALQDKWIRIEVSNQEHYVEISVVDSGRGIPKELHEKIMQPFYTTKDIGKGTGLGLSISKGMIESHQGKLYLDKDSPHTRFTVILPKIQQTESSDKKEAI